jgi:hypothetical protein
MNCSKKNVDSLAMAPNMNEGSVDVER